MADDATALVASLGCCNGCSNSNGAVAISNGGDSAVAISIGGGGSEVKDTLRIMPGFEVKANC